MRAKFIFMFLIFGGMAVHGVLTSLRAQEVKHPDMEVVTDDNGEQVVVVVATQRPPDPRLYVVKQEETPKGPLLTVIYKPTGELVQFFNTTTIKGKAEGPGVSLFASRVAPNIEKVIGQKSYEREIKRRYLDLIFIDKERLIEAEKIDKKEIDRMLERRRN